MNSIFPLNGVSLPAKEDTSCHLYDFSDCLMRNWSSRLVTYFFVIIVVKYFDFSFHLVQLEDQIGLGPIIFLIPKRSLQADCTERKDCVVISLLSLWSTYLPLVINPISRYTCYLSIICSTHVSVLLPLAVIILKHGPVCLFKPIYFLSWSCRNLSFLSIVG